MDNADTGDILLFNQRTVGARVVDSWVRGGGVAALVKLEVLHPVRVEPHSDSGQHSEPDQVHGGGNTAPGDRLAAR